MDLCIRGGMVIDPSQKIESKLNIGVKDGKIACLSSDEIEADNYIDAEGLIVTPAFIDCHMHEGNLDPVTGEIDKIIFEYALKMGVGTVIGGNCGVGSTDVGKYLDKVDSEGLPVNIGLLAPHGDLRKLVGAENKYEGITENQLEDLKTAVEKQLRSGALGISFGISYTPGITTTEFMEVASLAREQNKIITAHVRNDAAFVFEAAKELLDVSEKLGVPTQFSHIGSMGSFGQMKDLLSMIDSYRARNLSVMMDCYPYAAFCTWIGATTYDEGFLERYGIDYSSIEVAEGKYKGTRLTESLFRELRENAPDTLTIGHVMNQEEVDMAITHPLVMVASDGLINSGMGHPRAAGAFPRFIKRYVKELKALSISEAIAKITINPARHFGINSKGSLKIGSDADITIFNLETIMDCASFENSADAPKGVCYTILSGKIAAKDSKIINGTRGRSVRK